MELRRLHFWAPLALIALLVACGDDPVGPGGGPGNEREILAQPSFATNINEIFQRTGCSAGFCHGGAGGAGGLMLTANAAANHGMLVGVPSTWNVNVDRVIPNDANGSFLVIKLENRQAAGQGGRMPLNGTPLDNIDMANIKNWINNGAPNN